MNLALRCHALEKRYGRVVAVNGLSLDIARGECFGLRWASDAQELRCRSRRYSASSVRSTARARRSTR